MDELVKALTNEQGEIEKSQLVGGFMGPGDEESGKVRFYLDPALTSWLGLAPESILHSVKLKPTQSVIGGTLIWLSTKATQQERTVVPAGIPLPENAAGGTMFHSYGPQAMGI